MCVIMILVFALSSEFLVLVNLLQFNLAILTHFHDRKNIGKYLDASE